MAIDKYSLRLGNLVVLAHESNAPIATVKEIRTTCALVDEGDHCEWISYDLLLPIELNEYWAHKLGFTECSCEGWRGHIHIDKGFRYNNIPINSVHHLMNLTFFLTGKELTIKEPINE